MSTARPSLCCETYSAVAPFRWGFSSAVQRRQIGQIANQSTGRGERVEEAEGLGLRGRRIVPVVLHASPVRIAFVTSAACQGASSEAVNIITAVSGYPLLVEARRHCGGRKAANRRGGGKRANRSFSQTGAPLWWGFFLPQCRVQDGQP